MLVALVALGTILSWFDQFQFFFYVKIWTKTKSYVCFIMCDMLLKDMHIGIFNLLVLQQILLRSLDVSSLKNILLNYNRRKFGKRLKIPVSKHLHTPSPFWTKNKTIT